MLLDALKRARHTRGYGVHSPYGYALVTRAVRPKGCAWYGYADIRNSLAQNFDRRIWREACMLLRLAAFLRPGSVYLPAGANLAYNTAISAADSRTGIVKAAACAASCDMICSVSDVLPLDVLQRALERPGACVAVRNVPVGWTEALFGSLAEGIALRGKRNLIMVHRPGMQKILYTVNIG